MLFDFISQRLALWAFKTYENDTVYVSAANVAYIKEELKKAGMKNVKVYPSPTSGKSSAIY